MQFLQNMSPGKPGGMDLAEVIGGDEDSLRTFIAAHSGRALIPGGGKVIVTIGHKPEDGTLAEIKLPDKVRILGAVQRPSLHDELLFSIEESEIDFKASFTTALVEAGWQDAPMYTMHGGFAGTGIESIRFCHPGKEQILQLTLQENGLGYINIHNQRKPCTDPHQAHMTIMNVLPVLNLPQGIEVQSYEQGGGSSGSGSVHTSASMTTNTTFIELHEHYRQQLGNQGWQLSHYHEDAHLAISTWQVKHDGESWRGLLLLMPVGDSGKIQIHLEMQVLSG